MSKPRQQGPHGTPEFIDLLQHEDKLLYEELQKNVGSPNFRYNRNRRLSTFMDLLECIREYCEHDEHDRWKRYLVCGICWFKDGIAINTRQLRLLISKSKSAINGAFAKMGYQTIPTKGEEASQLAEKIPFLVGHYSDLRQWTIRKISPLNDNEKIDFEKIEDEEENENKMKIEIKPQNVKDINKKTNIVPNDEFDIFDQDPYQVYDFDTHFKEPSEKEQEFSYINFYNDNFDTSYDYCFNYDDPNIFTIRVNPYPNIQLSIIKEAMKNHYSDFDKEMYHSKDF